MRHSVFVFVALIRGEFVIELKDISVAENDPFTLEFGTTSRPPDLYHTWPNSTVEKLIVNGQRTAVNNGCRFAITGKEGVGVNVTMTCEAAIPRHAGTYTGTDNDEAEGALKTTAVVAIVAGITQVYLVQFAQLPSVLRYR